LTIEISNPKRAKTSFDRKLLFDDVIKNDQILYRKLANCLTSNLIPIPTKSTTDISNSRWAEKVLTGSCFSDDAINNEQSQ